MAQHDGPLGMSESVMRLRCQPSELPSHLYRIQYPASQTRYTDEGLRAADTTTTYSSREVFGDSVRRHFTWKDRRRSSFISLFSDESYAKNWGCKEPWLGAEATQEDDWRLFSIDTNLLKDTVVFKLSRLVDFLNLKLPEKAEKHIEGGYICLHKIPRSAIVQEQKGTDIRHPYEYPIFEEDIASEELLRDLEAMGL
ncbi:hypothetical protein F5Y03DRAFT_350853 [Xylaria venustula]|nr:hypothetical protein F5Y03DRAFT_350853 [Xylaria venustula]